jgi:hypothetical protein
MSLHTQSLVHEGHSITKLCHAHAVEARIEMSEHVFRHFNSTQL